MKVTCWTPDRWTCESTGHGRKCRTQVYRDVVRMHSAPSEDGLTSISVSFSDGSAEFGMEVGEFAISLDESEVYIGQL